MKHIHKIKHMLLFIGFCIFISVNMHAQQTISYAYDNAGNRVSRTLVVGQPQGISRHDKDSVIYHEVLANKEITLYPNPVTTNLTVNVKGYNQDAGGEYYLFDMQGKVLLHNTMRIGSFQIDMSAYTAGNYIMRIVLDGESTTWKVIKK